MKDLAHHRNYVVRKVLKSVRQAASKNVAKSRPAPMPPSFSSPFSNWAVSPSRIKFKRRKSSH